MIIKELNLSGFGKFKNKRMELKKGLNIIYGENEAGKSTIHNFINGMFYGFLKPYVKRTIYLDEHEMYKPWSGNRYSGNIKFETDEIEYIIEREFTRSQETTKVLLEKTGEDITDQIDTRDKTRIIQPGNYFFGFNDAVYGNTISVKQSDSIVEDDLSKEIKDKLINLSTGKDEELSSNRAIAELERAIREIGSIRAQTSYYGRSYLKLVNLQDEKREISKNKNEYLDALEAKSNIDKRINTSNQEIKQLEELLERAILFERNNVYKEVKTIKNRAIEFKETLREVEEFKDTSLDDYLKGIKLEEELENIRQRNIDLQEDFMEVENNIKQLKDKSSLNLEQDNSIEKDFMEYEQIEEKEKDLRAENNNEIEFLKRDIKDNKEKIRMNSIILFIGIITSLISIVLSFISSKLFLSINIIFLPLAVYSFIKAKSAKSSLENQQIEVENLEIKQAEKNTTITGLEEDKRSLLNKYKSDNKFELKTIFDKYIMNSHRNNEQDSLLEEYKNRKVNILKQIEKYESQYNNSNTNLGVILENNSTSNLEELKEGVEKAKQYKELEGKLSSTKELLNRVLGDRNFDDLDREFKDYYRLTKEDVKHSSSELSQILKDKYERLSNIKIEKSSIDSRIDFLDRSISKLVEIEESIFSTENLLKLLDEKLSSLELSRDTIKDLSKEIQREFAPVLNERVGYIVDRVTDGKYSKIKIDDNLEMGVIDNITGEKIDIKDLSGGTIDQLYFALRFGIIDSLTDKTPPLILDDCFVQYDNNRLNNMLDLLLEESKVRQVILFTCHKREAEVLYNKEISFNLIDLSI